MSNTAINTFRRAALAASLAAALALQPALAQDKTAVPPPPKAGAEHCPDMDHHGDPAAHLQKKLDDLGAKLHLKDSQQTAWKTYRSQVAELSAARHQHTEGSPEPGEQFKNLTAPERLQKAADRMRAGAEQLDKLAKQTGTFYKTLSPEQQTIFDLYQRDMKPHRMPGHHGR
jgi:hypothetical protein